MHIHTYISVYVEIEECYFKFPFNIDNKFYKLATDSLFIVKLTGVRLYTRYNCVLSFYCCHRHPRAPLPPVYLYIYLHITYVCVCIYMYTQVGGIGVIIISKLRLEKHKNRYSDREWRRYRPQTKPYFNFVWCIGLCELTASRIDCFYKADCFYYFNRSFVHSLVAAPFHAKTSFELFVLRYTR